MNLLLDSHAFLWALGDDPALGRQVRAALERDDVQVSLSTATVWELGVKHSLGRLHLPVTLRELVASAVAARMRVLSIVPEHALRAGHRRQRLVVLIAENLNRAEKDVGQKEETNQLAWWHFDPRRQHAITADK